jgi:hypothetical protein
MEEKNIKIEMSVSEVNTILATLGKQPFAEVAHLISKIKIQGDAQVTVVPEETEEEG